jgi:GT2 family glycosyltransferase
MAPARKNTLLILVYILIQFRIQKNSRNIVMKNREDKITNYFFAPFTMYKEVWNSIGGHDTQFRRSREDSDVLNRLILAGNKIVQTWEALVYHFTCTSSRGKDWFNPQNTKAQERVKIQQQADNIELRRFIKKWGNFSHGNPINYYYNIDANININEDIEW